jgi:hypothetical protein
MREHAVILTYPGHFYLTQLTIRSVREHIQPKDITVIADDWSFLTWDSYVEDCKQTYTDCNIIHSSQFEFLKPFEGNPWVRQQMIKLNLHKILDFDKWFFTDGDIEFFHNVPENVTPYNLATIPEDVWENWDNAPLADKETLLMANYVNSMLGMNDFWDLPAKCSKEKPNQVVATSGAPFRDMNKELLNEVEQFLTERFGVTLSDIHVKVMKDESKAMTEWELLEAYRLYVRKESLNMVRFYPYSADKLNELHDNEDMIFLMHFLSDLALGAEWFQERNIKVDKATWEKIPTRRY